MAANGMDGNRLTVAVVDTGINVAYLRSKGRAPKLDTQKSWTPAGVSSQPGQHPVNHGTMCAYDVGIFAEKATLIDYAVTEAGLDVDSEPLSPRATGGEGGSEDGSLAMLESELRNGRERGDLEV